MFAWVRTTAPAIHREVLLIALYFVLRTLDVQAPIITLWAGAVALLAIIAPRSGLVVLAAIAPFADFQVIRAMMSDKDVIVAGLAVGVLWQAITDRMAFRDAGAASVDARAVAGVDASADTDALTAVDAPTAGDVPGEVEAPDARGARTARWARYRPLFDRVLDVGPEIMAAVVLGGTALGLLYDIVYYDPTFAADSGWSWWGGIGGAFVCLFAARWVSRTGEIRPLVAAAVSAGFAGLLSLAEFLDSSLVRGTFLDWTMRPVERARRLSGVVNAPNAVAVIMFLPLALLLAAAVLSPRRQTRIVAAALSVPLLVAEYLTYSRSAIIALAFVVVLYAWRIRRVLAPIAIVVLVVAVLVVLPQVQQIRAGAKGKEDGPTLVTKGDLHRERTWAAAFRMWLASPVTGMGFRSFSLFHADFGEKGNLVPHNEWLQLFAEEGIIVGGGGLGFGLLTFLRLERNRSWLGTGLWGVFSGYAVMAAFNNPLIYDQVTIVTFIAIGTGLALARGPTGPPRAVAVEARPAAVLAA